MTTPLVSCIVPVFNGERYLRDAIDSILAQTHRAIEVIVADDGSTDDTARVADAFGAPVLRVAQANQGPAAARNLGLQHARGDLIAFLDADDLWAPAKIERQLALLRQHPNAGACVGGVRNFWQDQTREEADKQHTDPRALAVVGFSTPNMLAHRWAFDRVGRFDTTLGHSDDTDWFMRARAAGVHIEVLAEVLCFRRIHQTNRSRVRATTSVDEYMRLLKRHLDKKRSGNG